MPYRLPAGPHQCGWKRQTTRGVLWDMGARARVRAKPRSMGDLAFCLAHFHRYHHHFYLKINWNNTLLSPSLLFVVFSHQGSSIHCLSWEQPRGRNSNPGLLSPSGNNLIWFVSWHLSEDLYHDIACDICILNLLPLNWLHEKSNGGPWCKAAEVIWGAIETCEDVIIATYQTTLW